MSDRGPLAGAVAIVTAATTARGRAVAALFLSAGTDVVLADERQGPLQDLATELAAATDRSVHAVLCDLDDPSAIDAVTEQAVDRFGRVDLVCSVGRTPPQTSPSAPSD